MGIFSKPEFNEEQLKSFWVWFQNNQINDILQINKEMGERLQEICGGGHNTAWYEMGWDLGRNKAYITFWADGGKQTRGVFKKLIELAPDNIKEQLMLRVEN
ncbi:MAG: hypothetical protein LBN07_05105 [Christensenellaceae bacterium]|jgi:hypothetical protein|nr:hypothetical protein [Christensenellaceae bacterium]